MLKQLFLLRKDVTEIKEAIFGGKSYDMLALPQSTSDNDYDFPPMGSRPMPHTPVFHQNVHHNADEFHDHEEDTLINSSKIGEVSMADMERELIEETLKNSVLKNVKLLRHWKSANEHFIEKLKNMDCRNDKIKIHFSSDGCGVFCLRNLFV